MQRHKLNVTLQELVVIREAIHSITIKGSDSVIVGSVLDKVNKGIEKLYTATNTAESNE